VRTVMWNEHGSAPGETRLVGSGTYNRTSLFTPWKSYGYDFDARIYPILMKGGSSS